jgi:hypothetical protein
MFIWYEWCLLNPKDKQSTVRILKQQGWGQMKSMNDMIVPVVDIDDRQHGVINIILNTIPYRENKRNFVNLITQKQLYEKYRVQVERIYNQIDKHHNDVFQYVVVQSKQRIPMPCFVRLCNEIKFKNQQANDLFLHLFRVAAWFVDVPEATSISFNSASSYTKGTWIAHMVLMIQSCLPYVEDKTCNDERSCDLWSRINCSPDPSQTANDCEDGTLSILELLYVLRTAEFTSRELQWVQKFVNRYTPFLAIGQMATDPSLYHVYAVLLDTESIEKRR